MGLWQCGSLTSSRIISNTISSILIRSMVLPSPPALGPAPLLVRGTVVTKGVSLPLQSQPPSLLSTSARWSTQWRLARVAAGSPVATASIFSPWIGSPRMETNFEVLLERRRVVSKRAPTIHPPDSCRQHSKCLPGTEESSPNDGFARSYFPALAVFLFSLFFSTPPFPLLFSPGL